MVLLEVDDICVKGELLTMENKAKKVWVKPQATIKSVSEKPEYRKAYEEVNGKK